MTSVPTQSQPPSAQRRHRSLSVIQIQPKRSPSPRVAFTAASLSPDGKGVKDITRKVIRTLEGLGHLDSTDMYEQDCEPDEKLDREVPVTLNGSANHHASPSNLARSSEQHGTSSNGVATHRKPVPKVNPPEYKKIDWEIPRKLLHSSIGFFTIYLYISEGDVKTIVLVLWTALAVIVPADICRLRYPRFARIYERFLGFLMRESEKKSINGVVWYILGVNFALTYYPQDVATVAILILSWADTAASTFGRLLGPFTPPLPANVPILRLPLAPRKSLAGFLAATFTGALIAVNFWGWIAPLRPGTTDISWRWQGGVHNTCTSLGITSGWVGLGAIGVVTGLVSGIAEALDLGSLDDNLTLPIISGGCILGFFKLLRLLSTCR